MAAKLGPKESTSSIPKEPFLRHFQKGQMTIHGAYWNTKLMLDHRQPELLAHSALLTFLTYTIFKRERIWEDSVHSYAEMYTIFTAWKLRDLLEWETLPARIQLSANFLFQVFLRWMLEPRVAPADVAVYVSTTSCCSFYEKWVLTREAVPIFHLCRGQSHLDSSDPRLCLPASARGSAHARLT